MTTREYSTFNISSKDGHIHYDLPINLKNKFICVIRDLAMALKFSVYNKVCYITDDIVNKEKFDSIVLNNPMFGKDDESVFIHSIDGWNNIKKIIIENCFKGDYSMKFDYIIANPPYGEKKVGNRDLHLDIANKLMDLYKEEMIFLMPPRIAFANTDKFNNYRRDWKKLECVENIGNPWNETSNGPAVTVGIFKFINHEVSSFTYYDTFGNKSKTNSLMEISPFSDYENKFMNLLKSDFAEKYIHFMGYEPSKYLNILGKYNFSINRENGKMNGSFFSNVLINEKVKTKSEMNNFLLNYKAAHKVCVVHNNKNFLKNLKNAMLRPVLRFGLYKMQDDQNMPQRVLKYIPNIDWSDVRTNTDEGILELCGCSKKDAKEFATYCKEQVEKFDKEFFERKEQEKIKKRNKRKYEKY